MVVSIAAVISIDGKMTRGSEPDTAQWASKEDQVHFHSLIAEHEAIVMGSGTYKVHHETIKLSPKHLRIVLTSKPEQFASRVVKGQLEFYNLTPRELVDRLSQDGKKNLLVTGGGQMITDFLQMKLVNYFYLTIEPNIFGSGKPLITETLVNTSLKLISSQTLNKIGTVLLTYKVQ